jgi:hypothetical protein
MTRAMEQAIERLKRVPETQQEELAQFLLHELEEDERWAATTQSRRPQLDRLIKDVLADHAAGKTRPLDPDAL